VKQQGLGTRTPLIIYFPYLQAPGPFLLSFATIVARTSTAPLSLVNPVRQQIQAVDKDMPVFDVATMEQLVYSSVSEPRFHMLLLGIFAAIALVLAAAGIYGVMFFSVVQRTQEIGVRLALGAEFRDIFKLVVRQGMILALTGLGVGLTGALGLTRVISGLLYGIAPNDPLTFMTVSFILTGVALAACTIPARRATKVDPMVALRYE
jgi:putative ABC transport system permease protein